MSTLLEPSVPTSDAFCSTYPFTADLRRPDTTLYVFGECDCYGFGMTPEAACRHHAEMCLEWYEAAAQCPIERAAGLPEPAAYGQKSTAGARLYEVRFHSDEDPFAMIAGMFDLTRSGSIGIHLRRVLDSWVSRESGEVTIDMAVRRVPLRFQCECNTAGEDEAAKLVVNHVEYADGDAWHELSEVLVPVVVTPSVRERLELKCRVQLEASA